MYFCKGILGDPCNEGVFDSEHGPKRSLLDLLVLCHSFESFGPTLPKRIDKK